KSCGFPQINHEHLYYEDRYRADFPVPVRKQYSYYCNNAFVAPSGSYWDYTHCTIEGWIPEVPCLRQCVFQSVENGCSPYLEKLYVQDQSVKVECYPGCSLPNGQDTITYTENGWSPPPKCICVNLTGKCGPPPPTDSGDITSFPLPVYPPASSVEYQCQALYQLQGSKTITCRNGEWSEPPKCL
uniref:Sushi domain-containing protein n=2 Tax=Nannospalax galili TaxID=1026970 RepID=A0A8C6QXU6_NANGA